VSGVISVTLYNKLSLSGLISEIQNDKFNLPEIKSSIAKLSKPKINIVLI